MKSRYPFEAAVGNVTEEEMKKRAKPGCKKCNGIGREGFIEGVAIVCRCVKDAIINSRMKPIKYEEVEFIGPDSVPPKRKE